VPKVKKIYTRYALVSSLSNLYIHSLSLCVGVCKILQRESGAAVKHIITTRPRITFHLYLSGNPSCLMIHSGETVPGIGKSMNDQISKQESSL
jgi:hypothetical protein